MSSPANEAAARASTVASIGQTIPTDAEVGPPSGVRWGMVVDLDRCTGCQACVVACQAENNIALNEEQRVLERRAKTWIRIERYWEGEFPNAKARFIPVLCQHCGNAPCETVCPSGPPTTTARPERPGLQPLHRHALLRQRCPYSVRYFNFWNPEWPEPLNTSSIPTSPCEPRASSRSAPSACSGLTRVQIKAKTEGREIGSGEVQPACAQSCPTSALVFADINDPSSYPARLAEAEADRSYTLLENFGTDPGIIYLKKVDPHAEIEGHDHAPVEAHA